MIKFIIGFNVPTKPLVNWESVYLRSRPQTSHRRHILPSNTIPRRPRTGMILPNIQRAGMILPHSLCKITRRIRKVPDQHPRHQGPNYILPALLGNSHHPIPNIRLAKKWHYVKLYNGNRDRQRKTLKDMFEAFMQKCNTPTWLLHNCSKWKKNMSYSTENLKYICQEQGL